MFYESVSGMSRVEKKVGSGFGSGFQNFLRIGFRVEKSPGFGSRVGSVKNLNMKPNFSERLGILVICGINKRIYNSDIIRDRD